MTLRNSFLLTGRGQQLTAIQNIVHQRLADSGQHGAALGLPVDSSVNLERAFISGGGGGGFGYSPVPATRYGPGQVRSDPLPQEKKKKVFQNIPHIFNHA